MGFRKEKRNLFQYEKKTCIEKESTCKHIYDKKRLSQKLIPIHIFSFSFNESKEVYDSFAQIVWDFVRKNESFQQFLKYEPLLF